MAGEVLLLGASGLLGSAFLRHLGARALVAHRKELQPHALLDGRSLVHRSGCATVINCIADTRVEAAESDPQPAFYANAVLPGLLARAARQAGCRFVHFASTGCYGDGQADPWDDFADPRPGTVHHRSKLAGEREVRQAAPDALILRTGWLYGTPPPGRRDFVAMIRDQALGTDRLYSDPGQSGNPTHVGDVVAQTLYLIDRGVEGTLNCVAQGVARRLDYVRAIVAAFDLPTAVDAAPPGHFTRRAPVSPNEAAVNLKLQLLGLQTMPDWQTALAAHVRSRRDGDGADNA